jgi:hypothetical protein
VAPSSRIRFKVLVQPALAVGIYARLSSNGHLLVHDIFNYDGIRQEEKPMWVYISNIHEFEGAFIIIFCFNIHPSQASVKHLIGTESSKFRNRDANSVTGTLTS